MDDRLAGMSNAKSPSNGTQQPVGETRPRRVAVAPAAVLALLRAVVGSPFLARLPDEDAGTMGRPLPNAMVIDVGAWVAWCLAGLHVCARLELGRDPDDEDEHTSWLEVAGEAAKRVVTVLAMCREGGNISHAAAGLRTSRRALRDRLKDANLYPWPRSPEPTPQQGLVALRLPSLAASVLAMVPLALALVGSDDAALKAANGPGALAVVNALAAILERAEVLRTDGYDSLAAIARAVSERRPDSDLEWVAMAAWTIAVGSIDGTSSTVPDGSDVQGGQS